MILLALYCVVVLCFTVICILLIAVFSYSALEAASVCSNKISFKNQCADIKKTYDSFANAVQFFVCMICLCFSSVLSSVVLSCEFAKTQRIFAATVSVTMIEWATGVAQYIH